MSGNGQFSPLPQSPILQDGVTHPCNSRFGASSQALPSPIPLLTAVYTSTVKLDNGNYMIWEGHLLTAIVAGGYEEFIYGSTRPPIQFLDAMLTIENVDFKL